MRDHKVLLVTGASSDVGSALIRKAAEGYETILAHYCRSYEAVAALKEELGDKLILIQADFSDMTSVEKMASEVERLGLYPDHIVHFPSPKVSPQKFHKSMTQQYEEGFTISVLSIVELLRRFIPKMSRQHYGKIIFMLTSFTLYAPPKFQAPYITSKYALLGLMRDLAREYADKGIMVNAVSPDMMETRFLSDMPELVVQQNAANSLAGRNLVPVDVIPTFQYLLSDGADMVSGQNIGVTGG